MRVVTSLLLALIACDADRGIHEPTPSTDPDTDRANTDRANTDRADTANADTANTDPDLVTDPVTDSVPAVPRTVRLIALAERDLLGSETRAFRAIERALDAARFDAVLVTPDAEEHRAARPWLDASSTAQWARSWAGVETVVLFELAPPELDRRGRAIGRGATRVAVLRSGHRVPHVRLVASPEAGFVLDDRAGAWLLDLVSGLDEGGAP